MPCITPLSVLNKISGKMIAVECGKCPNCLKKRVSGWSFRLMQEQKVSSSSYFITLTYDTDHVPLSANGFMDIRKRDIQLFFKRLRKAHERDGIIDRIPSRYQTEGVQPHRGIKYYAVGEYGGKTCRPHYHIILFNCRIELVEEAWTLGKIHVGQVEEASVGYTLKYINKKGKIPMHRNDDRTPEFSLMSKGLGETYITVNMKKWHKDDLDNRMYCPLNDGRKISMPRYYKEKIYADHERKRIAFFQKIRILSEEQKEMERQGEDYFNNKAVSDKHRFDKMEYQNSKRDKL